MPLTRDILLKKAAEVVKKFITTASNVEPCESWIKFGKDHLNADNLYLLEVRRYGSTVQPVFGFLEEGNVISFPASCDSAEPPPIPENAEPLLSYDRPQYTGTAAEYPIHPDNHYHHDSDMLWPVTSLEYFGLGDGPLMVSDESAYAVFTNELNVFDTDFWVDDLLAVLLLTVSAQLHHSRFELVEPRLYDRGVRGREVTLSMWAAVCGLGVGIGLRGASTVWAVVGSPGL
ncbi:hypothetical protein PHLGIDRAFT_119962 [Phlebiopsis gigantea 11061_1 CR5-6]|uniref:Uncharacterized protein n=1 Tax=Phlebiopsis gigantea (strain 11061_1 CR5-6) TaxID=745531 RepID=A0A0C3NK52_PHLG1|nr:hypothetical protein PHLGIDRAFT_119962 [Phlebiopsis gigantea 11061_1 CR5-6]